MTWVIGRAGPFGHAVALSDIRVTLGDGSECDCLQKIHRVTPNMVLGFAGSVAIGLEAVAQMRVALHRERPTDRWDPRYVAETLPDGMSQLFESFSAEERSLKCELMLFSAHPTKNDGAAPWARCYVHRFYSPQFEPVEAPQAQIVSIGSGAHIQPYANALEKLGNDMEMFKLEAGFPGGSGLGLMVSLSPLLRRTPTSGISQFLQIFIVGRSEVRFGNNGSDPESEAQPNMKMPEVARDMQELRKLLGKMNVPSVDFAKC
jgi:hypothetical protein